MECNLCEFKCKYKSDFDRHNISKPHIKLTEFQRKLEEANLTALKAIQEKTKVEDILLEVRKINDSLKAQVSTIKTEKDEALMEVDRVTCLSLKRCETPTEESLKPKFNTMSTIVLNESFESEKWQTIPEDISFYTDNIYPLKQIQPDHDFKAPDAVKPKICRLRRCKNFVENLNWNKCKKHATIHKKIHCMFCDKKISKQNMKQHYESCTHKTLEEDPFLKRTLNKNRYYCPDCYACPLRRDFSKHVDICKDSRFTKEKCAKCQKLVVLNAIYVFGSKTKLHKHTCKEADLSKMQCMKCKKLICMEKYDDHVWDNKCFIPKLRNITIYKNGRKKFKARKLNKCFYCKITTLNCNRLRHLRKCKFFRAYLVIKKYFIKKYLNARNFKMELINCLFKPRTKNECLKETLTLMNEEETTNPGLINRKRLRPDVTVQSIEAGEHYDFEGNKYIDETSKIDINLEVQKACDALKVTRSFIKKPTKSIDFLNNLIHHKNIDLITNQVYRMKKTYIADIRSGLPAEYLDNFYDNEHVEFIRIPMKHTPKTYPSFKLILRKKIRALFPEIDPLRLDEPHIEQHNIIQFCNKSDVITVYIYDPKFAKMRTKYAKEFAYMSGLLENTVEIAKYKNIAETNASRLENDLRTVKYNRIKILESIEKSYEYAGKHNGFQRTMFAEMRRQNLKKELRHQKEISTKTRILTEMKHDIVLDDNELCTDVDDTTVASVRLKLKNPTSKQTRKTAEQEVDDYFTYLI
jgi:hypothetical protein